MSMLSGLVQMISGAISSVLQKLGEEAPKHAYHAGVDQAREWWKERQHAKQEAHSDLALPIGVTNHMQPIGPDECPADHPIKGSGGGIYHLPGGRFYSDTKPVRCFATEAEAEAAGFRPSRRG